MSLEVYNAVARRSDALARELDVIARQLSGFGEKAVSVIGGTATGEDRELLALASQSAQHARRAAQAYAEAAQLARRAAAEAAEAGQDRRRDPRRAR